jgi:hypothetical protein
MKISIHVTADWPPLIGWGREQQGRHTQVAALIRNIATRIELGGGSGSTVFEHGQVKATLKIEPDEPKARAA